RLHPPGGVRDSHDARAPAPVTGVITAVALACVGILVCLLLWTRVRGGTRPDPRERLRPLALAFAQGRIERRPELSGRDALVFAELLDELSRDPSLSVDSGAEAEPEQPDAPAAEPE